jgi:fatty-acyl-CoA synthase
VLECVVFGLPSARWGQDVAAIVHAPTLGDAEALLAAAREGLGSTKAPKQLRLSAKPLPKTASGKIARTGLEALFAAL